MGTVEDSNTYLQCLKKELSPQELHLIVCAVWHINCSIAKSIAM